MRSAALRTRALPAASAADLALGDRRRRARSACDAAVRSPERLIAVLAERSPRLARHHAAVSELTALVAADLALPTAARAEAVRAATVHDIGKVDVPLSILDKRGTLDEDELAIMRQHTVIGAQILSAAGLRRLAPIVRATHERWDGSGYPDGLRGEDIPGGARIITICDAYDAMTNERPYRPARPVADALDEVRRGAGRRYDPRIVTVFLAVLARLSAARG